MPSLPAGRIPGLRLHLPGVTGGGPEVVMISS
jgi:hypothetical protein